MDLLTLNLNKPLVWSRAAEAGASPAAHGDGPGADSARDKGSAAEAAFARALLTLESASEGHESALFLDWAGSIDESGDDGPRARRPLPEPIFVGERSGPAAGGAEPSEARLEPGRYAFVQARAPAEAAPRAAEAWFLELVEWFARESWWTGAACVGPLIARLVREDGKTAVQLLRAVLSTPS